MNHSQCSARFPGFEVQTSQKSWHDSGASMLPPDAACNLGIQLLVGWHFQPQKHGNIITATATSQDPESRSMLLQLHRNRNQVAQKISLSWISLTGQSLTLTHDMGDGWWTWTECGSHMSTHSHRLDSWIFTVFTLHNENCQHLILDQMVWCCIKIKQKKTLESWSQGSWPWNRVLAVGYQCPVAPKTQRFVTCPAFLGILGRTYRSWALHLMHFNDFNIKNQNFTNKWCWAETERPTICPGMEF